MKTIELINILVEPLVYPPISSNASNYWIRRVVIWNLWSWIEIENIMEYDIYHTLRVRFKYNDDLNIIFSIAVMYGD